MAGPWEQFKQIDKKSSQTTEADAAPWEQFKSVQPVQDKYSTAQTGVEQFGQGALMGYLPHVQAGAEQAISGGLGLMGIGPSAVDEDLRSKGFNVPEHGYVQSRDENIKRLQEQQAESPYLSGAAQLGGGIASTVAGGAGLGKLGFKAAQAAPGLIGRLKQAAGAGAVAGAIQNPEDVSGEVNPIQIGDRVSNAAKGAAFGAAAQGVGEVVVKGVKTVIGLGKAAKEAAATFALKQVGAAKKDFTQLYRKDSIEEMGKFVQDSGIIDGAPSPETVIKRISEGKKSAGAVLDEVYSTIHTDEVPVDPNEVVQSVLDRVSVSKARPGRGSKAKIFDDEMMTAIDDIAKHGDGLKDPRVVNDLIGEFDEGINYSKKMNELPAVQNGLYEIRDALRDHLKDLTKKVGDQIGDKQLLQRYLDANNTYSKLSQLQSMATNKASSNAVNRLFSLTDYQSAIGVGLLGAGGSAANGDGGALSKGLMIGAAGALGNRAARKYGPGTLSNIGSGASRIGNTISPGLMANQNPTMTGLIGAQLAPTNKREKK